MSKLIYNALYHKESSVKSPNSIGGNGVEIYLKNSFVSLFSAKYHNPNCDVAIVTNQTLPEPYHTLYVKTGIKEIIVPFEKYIFPENFKWGYAFYKLQALEYVVKSLEYDTYLALDTDTYINLSLDSLWSEVESNKVILYTLNYDTENSSRRKITEDYNRLFHKSDALMQYGGEFICGKRDILLSLVDKISMIYERIKSDNYPIHMDAGDEAILSMAAHESDQIMSASPYICRFWTRKAYYTVHSNWKNVPIWHVPAEKNFGMIKMYRYIQKHEKCPGMRICKSYFNFWNRNYFTISMIQYYVYRVLH